MITTIMFMTHVANIYRRVPPLIRAMPFLILLLFAAEFLQHVAEINLGLYETGTLSPEARSIRLVFGMVKIFSIVLLIIVAMRWWRFAGDTRRAIRPSWSLVCGFIVFITLEILDGFLEEGIARLVHAIIDLDDAPLGLRYAVRFTPTLGWVFLSNLWLPWNVALLVDDPSLNLRTSITMSRGRLWSMFGVICAGIIPFHGGPLCPGLCRYWPCDCVGVALEWHRSHHRLDFSRVYRVEFLRRL